MEATVSSVVLFPELLRRETLIKILKYKLQKISANSIEIDRFNDDELLDFSRRFLVPKPQRQHGSKNIGIDDQKNTTLISCTQQCNRSDSKLGTKTAMNFSNCKTLKRKSDSEVSPTCKRRLKHSPIRYP
uniref:Ashwin n=1 Tax=Syphacia muris TaxID=451379 RepID=A0A0N5A9L4_9BILA